MSLNRLMLRAAVVRALKNKTIAQDRVFDSRLDPLQTSKPDDMLPAVCVYTESDNGLNQNDGGGQPVNFVRDLDLQLELTVGSWKSLEIPGPQGNPEQVKAFVIAGTDSELEALLDLFELQIKMILFGVSDEAIAVQKLVRQWRGWNSLPGRDDGGNTKLCARQVVIPVQLSDDCRLPVDGSVIAPGPRGSTMFPPLVEFAPYLQKLLEDMACNPAYATLRDLLQMIYGSKPLPPVGRVTSIGLRASFDGSIVDAPVTIDD